MKHPKLLMIPYLEERSLVGEGRPAGDSGDFPLREGDLEGDETLAEERQHEGANAAEEESMMTYKEDERDQRAMLAEDHISSLESRRDLNISGREKPKELAK